MWITASQGTDGAEDAIHLCEHINALGSMHLQWRTNDQKVREAILEEFLESDNFSSQYTTLDSQGAHSTTEVWMG